MDEQNIPDVGECVNIKSMPFIKDGKYKVTKKAEAKFHGVYHPRIFAEYVGDIDRHLYTLDFSSVIPKEG